MDKKGEYSVEFIITERECDVHGHMMPGAFLRRVQQIATDQCTSLGLTQEVYQRTNTAFLLAKQAAEFYLPAKAGQSVRLITHPSPERRAVYNRYTELQAMDGTLLCASDSRWVLVDTKTRRILRCAPEGFPNVFAVPCEKTLDLSVVKAETQPCGMQTALYTRCDRNRHLNNTVYADIVCDAVPLESMLAHSVSRLVILYHQEVPMGESFQLEQAQTQAHRWYFCGKQGKTRHFEADLTLNATQNRENEDKESK